MDLYGQSGGHDDDVNAQIVNGTKVGNEFRVNTHTSEEQVIPLL